MFPLGINSVVSIVNAMRHSLSPTAFFVWWRVNDDKIKEKYKLRSRKLNTARKICLSTSVNQFFFSQVLHAHITGNIRLIFRVQKMNFTCTYKQYYRIYFTESLWLTLLTWIRFGNAKSFILLTQSL